MTNILKVLVLVFGVPLPKALKCGTIQEALASYFFGEIHMKFDKVQFVYIDVDYIEYLI